MTEKTKISSLRAAAAAFLAIAALVAAQLLSNAVINTAAKLTGMPAYIGNIISAALYILLSLALLKPICVKILGISLSECGITKYKLKPVWAAAAFIMPAIAAAGLLMTSGHWENTEMDSAQLADSITVSVFVIGIAAGTVEEAVFRGVIMKALEMRWNKAAAVIVPSAVFGAAHALNGRLSVISFIQLLIAGSIVGVLFSLVTYESGNIWSAAFMHGIWNICMAGCILNIYTEPVDACILNYVLGSDHALVTGGEFGAEASVISIGAYLIFIAIAAILLKRRGSNK